MKKPQETRLSEVTDILNSLRLRFPGAEIQKRIGGNKGNISKMLSGKIPISDNFYTTFMEEFGGKPIQTKSTDQVGTLDERVLRLEGYATVLFETAVNILSQSTGKQAALISGELNEAISMAVRHRADELRRKV